MSLKGKVAIVTGGSRGIGEGIAKELGNRGAKVVITYAASPSRAQDVVGAINSFSDAIAIQADCMSLESPQRVVDATIQAFGERIDIIVNNAGAGDELFLEDITVEHFDKVMYTNVRFPIFLLKAALPYLQQGGRIVNMSSIVARQGFRMQSVYGASKACMESLARAFSVELGQKYGITINAVNPGPVATDMWNATPAESIPEVLISNTPAEGRVGEVDDVVQVVAFLCEEGSRWVTGSTICANGGVCPT